MDTASRSLQAAVATAALTIAITASSHAQPQIDPAQYGELEYRYIGPPGNRAISVAGIPGNPLIYYIGAASGGTGMPGGRVTCYRVNL